jgi:hypothetical protein
MDKKVYKKKIGKIANFNVWRVNGKYIRTHLDEEFTNFGQHYRFNFIPENEFWVDKEHGDGCEERYYIKHLLTENNLMANGTSYTQALEIANQKELKERHKSKLLKDIQKSKEELIKKIHKKFLKTHSNYIKVWVVDGELVRSLFFIDFTEGGHDKVYSFIPLNEIWIDDDISLKERKLIILHEAFERVLMSKGEDYDSSHKKASEIELYARKNPKELDRLLKRELKENNKLIRKAEKAIKNIN